MSVPPAEAIRRVAAMTEGLRSAGLRLTHQRLEILREIAAADEHPDVEAVFGAVRERVPTLSLDTAYRTIAALVDLGLVTRVSVIPGSGRYDANVGEHHHFVCTSCGLIVDIADAELDGLVPPAEVLSIGTVQRAEISFKGRCRACAASSDGSRKGNG